LGLLDGALCLALADRHMRLELPDSALAALAALDQELAAGRGLEPARQSDARGGSVDRGGSRF
jgi:hypothetical protein